MVVILTEAAVDPHAAYLKNLLRRRGESVVCLDPGKFPSSYLSTIRVCDNGSAAKVFVDGETTDLNAVKSFWYRRPSKLDVSSRLDLDYRDVALTEWRAFLNSLWEVTSSKTWVSSPARIRRAELKPLQLDLASQEGLAIPRTIITNDPEELIGFHSRCSGRVVGKKLYSHGIARKTGASVFATRVITEVSDETLESLPLCPCIFQEYVEKEVDVRVTIIDRQVFAVAIHSQELNEAKIDYRMAQDMLLELKHEVIRLPHAIERSCLRLVDRFGLRFSTMDFVKTDGGEYIFLEMNPNGQWLWLELVTGVELSAAMADLLTNRSYSESQ